MKKIWFPKIVCICVCVCASFFLFTSFSIGYYTPGHTDFGYVQIPGTDTYVREGPSPYEYGFPYNMGPAYDFYNYQLQHPYDTYLYQQPYNISGYGYPNFGFSGWNMPYNYGWNQQYGAGYPYYNWNQQPYNPYGDHGLYSNPYQDWYQQSHPYSSLTYEQLRNTPFADFIGSIDPQIAISILGSNGLGLHPYTINRLIPGVFYD